MPSVTLLRHATSVFNEDADAGNVTDCPLSVAGIAEARALEGDYDVVVCSPLQRTRQTYAMSQITTEFFVVSPLVREHITHECDRMAGETSYEQEESLLKRVNEARIYLLTLSKRFDRVLVVTHGDFAWYLQSYIVKGERFGKWLNNAKSIDYDL